MDNHGKSIAEYFTSGNFKHICHRLICDFGHIKVHPIKHMCGDGSVEQVINGKIICSKSFDLYDL